MILLLAVANMGLTGQAGAARLLFGMGRLASMGLLGLLSHMEAGRKTWKSLTRGQIQRRSQWES
jgi:hypothetical protein